MRPRELFDWGASRYLLNPAATSYQAVRGCRGIGKWGMAKVLDYRCFRLMFAFYVRLLCLLKTNGRILYRWNKLKISDPVKKSFAIENSIEMVK